MSHRGSEDDRTVRCGLCGDVIGVYEPLVAVSDETTVHASRAALGERLPAADGYFHRDCYLQTRSSQ